MFDDSTGTRCISFTLTYKPTTHRILASPSFDKITVLCRFLLLIPSARSALPFIKLNFHYPRICTIRLLIFRWATDQRPCWKLDRLTDDNSFAGPKGWHQVQ